MNQARFSSSIHQTTNPKVAIVILNWNGWKDTIECVESVCRINYPSYDIVIVDNNSIDGSVGKIEGYLFGNAEGKSRYSEKRGRIRRKAVAEYTRAQIESVNSIKSDPLLSISDRKIVLIRNERNYGFAEGNNIAIGFALGPLKSDYVLLLNNDTIVEASFLTELVRVAERGDRIGIVGSKIYYYDFSGRSDVINFAGEDITLWKGKGVRYGFDEVDEGQHEKIKEVDKVDGACMLIKRTVLENVGVLDPSYFAYWEETDLCLRARKGGFKLLYVPKAKIWHKVSSSIGGPMSPDKEYYMTRNRFIFLKKNGSSIEKTRFLLYFFFLDLWLSTVSLVKRKGINLLTSFARGIRDGLREMV